MTQSTNSNSILLNSVGVNAAAGVAGLAFTANSDAPPAPIIYSVFDYATGPIAQGGTTSAGHPMLGGRGVPGDLVTVYDHSVAIGSTFVLASGNWSFTPSAGFGNGSHDLTATNTNSAGIDSAPSAHFAFTVEVPPPLPAPVLLGITEHLPDGTLDNVTPGGMTHDAAPVLVFAAVVGNTYTLYDNGVLIGTMIATKVNTGWFLPPLADGEHHLALTYTDIARTESLPLNTSFTVVTVPLPFAITEVVAIDGPLKGIVAAGGISTDGHPVINGTGHWGDTISVYDGKTLLGTTTVAQDGHWSYKPAEALANGAHNLHVTETNAAGTGIASADYPLSVTYIMITAVHDANGHFVADGGITQGAITVSGWISDPSIASAGSRVGLTGGNLAQWASIADQKITVVDNTFSFVLSKDSYLLVAGAEYPTNGTFTIGVQVGGSMGSVSTVQDPRLAYTVTNDFNATLPSVVAAHVETTHADADAAAAVLAAQSAETPVAQHVQHHVAVGDHDTFKGTTGNVTADLNVDPSVYFKAATAHIQGGTDGVSTLHLTGDHQVLDLTSLSGKTAAAKVSGIEVVDLGGAHNMLKLSLVDVLNLAEPDLFQKDGKQQMLINGSNGDSVDLSNSHVAGVALGHWMQEGTAEVGGVTYNVYEHSGAHAELLVQQGVQIALHG